MASFDNTGITTRRFVDIRSQLISRFRAKFGEEIRTDPASGFGAFIDILAELHTNAEESILQVSQILDPDQATGAVLSRLVQLNGIQRVGAVASVVGLTVTADNAGCTIQENDLVSASGSEVQWRILSELTLGANESGSVQAQATVAGPVTAAPNTITRIDTPRFGWATVTNPSIPTLGEEEETDAELRARREVVSKRTGTSTRPSIESALLGVENVSDVRVTTAVGGVTCTVLGGLDSAVAQAVFDNAAAGVPLNGSETVNITSARTGQVFPINFNRPTPRAVQIQMTIDTDATFPSSGVEQIQQAIVDWFNGNFTINGRTVEERSIGDDIIFARVYDPINSIPGHSVTSLQIRFTGGSYGTTDLAVADTEIATIQTSDINITTV